MCSPCLPASNGGASKIVLPEVEVGDSPLARGSIKKVNDVRAGSLHPLAFRNHVKSAAKQDLRYRRNYISEVSTSIGVW